MHTTLLQVIHDNRKEGERQDEHSKMPLLVYLAREKRPSHPHRFKAGAENALVCIYTYYFSLSQSISISLVHAHILKKSNSRKNIYSVCANASRKKVAFLFYMYNHYFSNFCPLETNQYICEYIYIYFQVEIRLIKQLK